MDYDRDLQCNTNIGRETVLNCPADCGMIGIEKEGDSRWELPSLPCKQKKHGIVESASQNIICYAVIPVDIGLAVDQ